MVKNSRIELAKHVFEGSRFMERRNIQVKRVASLGHGGLARERLAIREGILPRNSRRISQNLRDK